MRPLAAAAAALLALAALLWRPVSLPDIPIPYAPVVTASYYWRPQPVACEREAPFNPEGFTAAHRTLPCGTLAEVTHLASGRVVRVRITDRGPFIAGRDLDLSLAAARNLGMLDAGLARVRIEVSRLGY